MPSSAHRLLRAVAAFLFLCGAGARIAPFASDTRTINATTEDGYLMMTVARNLAMGRGLSIAEGTIPTNGIQPAITFAWAGAHVAAGGDRLIALRIVLAIEACLALVTAIVLRQLAGRSFRGSQHASTLASLSAGLWFASPLIVRHTSNGLETGPYALAIALFLLVSEPLRARGATGAVMLGLLLGALFLIRNDAVFFFAAWIGASFVAGGLRDRWQTWTRNQALTVLAACAVGLPWLWYNLRVFGHIVPISGRAQSLNVMPGENLVALPRVLAEYAWMWSPLPGFADRPLPALVILVMLAGASLVAATQWRRLDVEWQREWTVLLLGSVLLAAYYGVFFGASYFLSRYLIGLSLLTAVVAAAVAGAVVRVAPAPGTALILGMTFVLSLALGRYVSRGRTHPHMQVVQWVEAHVPDDVWVGAPQSGTLGYFHDRTINLDGKVNPYALVARAERRLFQYVVEDTDITYLVDWLGLVQWLESPTGRVEDHNPTRLGEHFVLLLKDPERNLVVLRRR